MADTLTEGSEHSAKSELHRKLDLVWRAKAKTTIAQDLRGKDGLFFVLVSATQPYAGYCYASLCWKDRST